MKLIDILKEIGDLSAGALPIKKPKIGTTVKKAIQDLNATAQRQKYAYDLIETKKTTYVATGEAIYNIVIEYDIDLSVKGKKPIGYTSTARVDFDVKGSKKFEDTNLNEQYKLISSVVESFLDFANQIEPSAPLKTISVYPKADDSLKPDVNSKRGRLYSIYIQKNLSKLPGKWKINTKSVARIILERSDINPVKHQ